MNKDEMRALLDALQGDIFYSEDEEGFDVTVDDFDGFDDDWAEVDRDYDDPEGVEAFLDMLEEKCDRQEGDYYVTYYFDGFYVEIGYSSFDI